MKEKVLITGGTGFLGKNLQQVFKPYYHKYDFYFVGQSYNNRSYRLEIQSECEQLFNLIKPNIVVHAAAKCGGIGLNQRQPADLMLFNLQMNSNVLEQLLELN